MLKEGIGASKYLAYNNLLFIITTIVSLDNGFSDIFKIFQFLKMFQIWHQSW